MKPALSRKISSSVQRMKIIRNISAMSRFSRDLLRLRKKIGFVPTMGALHQGHLSLIRRASRENDAVVVSVFVNPIQFGPGEDFNRYPRNLVADAALCRKEGVSALFLPSAEKMYPRGYATSVEVQGLSDVLCGRFRPGHFKGVATVVLKLLNIVDPQNVYLGAKDAQQAAVIRRMALDLNLALQVKVLPTVRGPDGLALSSRNRYLQGAQKEQALCLWHSLRAAERLISSGQRQSAVIKENMRDIVSSFPDATVEYIEIVDPDDLRPLPVLKKGGCLLALAVRIAGTRLIDNLKVEVK